MVLLILSPITFFLFLKFIPVLLLFPFLFSLSQFSCCFVTSHVACLTHYFLAFPISTRSGILNTWSYHNDMLAHDKEIHIIGWEYKNLGYVVTKHLVKWLLAVIWLQIWSSAWYWFSCFKGSCWKEPVLACVGCLLLCLARFLYKEIITGKNWLIHEKWKRMDWAQIFGAFLC